MRWALAGLCTVTAACAHYSARPLARGPDLAARVTDLRTDVARLRLGPLRVARIDPAAPLTPTDVAILAVLNSPGLAARRAAASVAQAQLFAAGLLPDPQLSLSADFPVTAGATTAYSLSPAIDIAAIITRGAALRSARASARQADLDVLWSEWEVAQQARQLAVTIVADEDRLALLQASDQTLTARYRESDAAGRRGDVTVAFVSGDLAAKLDADAQLATTLRDLAKARGELNALIGLAPDVRLSLAAGAEAGPDPVAVQAGIGDITDRRPDLLALKAGYEAQDAELRRAILAQFPLVTLGYAYARDNTGITSNGAAATLKIPLFNRGRGEIAIQSATREKLAAEYQARLDQSHADIAQAQRDLASDQAELERLGAEVPALVAASDRAAPALRRGDLDSGAYLAIEEAALKEEIALADARLARRLARIGLESVLFLPAEEGS